MLEKFSLEAQRVISSAESLSFDLSHNSIGCEHFLLAVLKIPDNILTINLKKYRITFKSVISDIKMKANSEKHDIFFMEYDESFKELLEEAQKESKDFKEDKVSLNTMLIAFLKNISGLCYKIFKENGVDISQLLALVIKSQRKHSDLDKIIDLHDLSSIKKDPLIGRKKELQQLTVALRRRNKPNAILIGAPGVGKTAIVEELAHLLAENKIPGLENKRIYELDIASVVGGTKYRGEFEEKLKRIIKNVNEDGNAILFIDEIHNIIKAGGAEGAIDASNILKPYLARGEIQIIGATTLEEYHNIFEKDKALNRRFQLIYVNPSTKEETVEILNQLKPLYEDYYKIRINNELMNYIVEVAEEFVPNQSFPDKALDILDNSCVCSNKNLTKECVNQTIEKFYNVSTLSGYKSNAVKNELKEKIIGQDSAIDKIYRALLQIEMKFNDVDCPLSTMLFYGPSGVGKTESAKIIAKNFFGADSQLIKIDMNCYKDSSSLNKLIGSAPGYQDCDNVVGFVQKIKNYPNSVVLLDEIDKASPDVLDFFLNIFDEGTFLDSHNNVINCRNIIFIMTANITGLDNKTSKNYLLTNEEEGHKKKSSKKHLKHVFREEFINRIQHLIEFNYISDDAAMEILEKISETYKFRSETTFFDIKKLSLDKEELRTSGARYLKRLVLNQLLTGITNKI